MSMMVYTVIRSTMSEMVNLMGKDPEAAVHHHGNVIDC